MARQYLKFPSFIQIGEDGASKRDIEERIEIITQDSQRKQKLTQLLNRYPQSPIMIFVNMKNDVETLHDHLTRLGKSVTSLHGSKN